MSITRNGRIISFQVVFLCAFLVPISKNHARAAAPFGAVEIVSLAEANTTLNLYAQDGNRRLLEDNRKRPE
jgi:hypothetical protein